MGKFAEIPVRTHQREEFINITAEVQRVVRESGVEDGVCTVFVPHTTAAVTINEGADPSVVSDILAKLHQLVPPGAGYRHLEGNSDAHIKSTLVGASEKVLVHGGRLMLGTWQAIFFCEFDGPRSRRVWVYVG
ncbi:MAG TPA: YjbQ family protein [Bacteroidetes bacterium]|nr:YjbQ family protein [Bacteroidota bacterium]